MIPGDWEWYLDSYRVIPGDGGRDWTGSINGIIQAYDCPATMRDQVVTAVAYVPMNAKRYSQKTLPAPEGVRWGIVTCLRNDFASLLGNHLNENAYASSLKLKNGALLREWIPIFIDNRISVPKGQCDSAGAVASLLDGKAMYTSNRHMLILRSDVYKLVSGFPFKGCRISTA